MKITQNLGKIKNTDICITGVLFFVILQFIKPTSSQSIFKRNYGLTKFYSSTLSIQWPFKPLFVFDEFGKNIEIH